MHQFRLDFSRTCLLSKLRLHLEDLQEEYSEVQLDLTGVTKMDAAGLGALVEAYAKCDAQGTKLKLYDVSRPVLQLLQLVKLLAVFGPCLAQERAEAA